MPARQIIQSGTPELKKRNKRLTSFVSVSLANLISDLKDTMYTTNLIGIAAPQIGENFSLFLTHPRSTKSRKLPKEDILRVYINPKITYLSKKMSVIYEGCGSVAGGELFGPVARPESLEIEAFDENGKKFSLSCDGILARVILHEIDHLAGIEFIQKVNDYGKLYSGENYRKYIKNSKAQLDASVISKIEYKEIT